MARRADPERYNLESVARTASVLYALETESGRALDQVAADTGLSDSTALRYLSSLITQGLVERDPATGTYALGLTLFRLGASAVQQRNVGRIAAPYFQRLLEDLQESVNLAARRADQVLVLEVHQSARSLRKGVTAGGIDSWHATSLGKAILAALPGAEVAHLVGEAPFPEFTPNTLTDLDALVRDLAGTRARGFAIDDEETEEGLRCVGVAIRDHTGAPVYAVSVSGPKSRMSFPRLSAIGDRLVDDVESISQGLGFRAGGSLSQAD
ncbi:IclR family transcriptional regulator [Occultella kanbiaonis]|uniref:IclR family transcriptional regulator n=1 Tax=Occultella kanbiaonis TaxID=2675754 RepID=UPI0013D47226|nr:IclR family transcriptional regulator [Occultella kanbiaonis]